MLFETLATAAGTLGTIGGYLGQRETNQTNARLQADANQKNQEEAIRNREFQQSSAREQMAFQERMANTQHQREVEDLKKAGLNPILSANSGNAAPSGAAAGGGQAQASAAQMHNPMANLTSMFSSAIQSASMLQGLEKQRAETGLIKAQTGKTGVETEKTKNEIPKGDVFERLWKFLDDALNGKTVKKLNKNKKVQTQIRLESESPQTNPFLP